LYIEPIIAGANIRSGPGPPRFSHHHLFAAQCHKARPGAQANQPSSGPGARCILANDRSAASAKPGKKLAGMVLYQEISGGRKAWRAGPMSTFCQGTRATR